MIKKLLQHPQLCVGIFFLFVVLVFGAPIFFGLTIFRGDSADFITQYYPYFDFYSNALHTGQSFLWVPQIFSGFPAYVSQVGGFFDPVNVVLFRIFSGLDGIHLRLALDMMLVCVCSYAAARALGISRLASALVGPSYLLAFHMRFLSNPIILNSLFLLPLLIFCITRAFAAQKIYWRFIVLAGMGVGWALLCGYTQVIFYAVFLSGLYALGHVWFVERAREPRYIAKCASAFVLLVGIGATLGLPQLLPAYTFLPLTSRAGPADYTQMTLKVISPGDMLLQFVPDYMYVPYITQGRKPLFVGALWALLAYGALLWALVPLFRRARGSSYVGPQWRPAIISFLFLFAFIAAFKWSPLYVVLSHLPIFDLFRFPFRFMYLGAFFWALLGAFGFDAATHIAESKPFRWVVYFLSMGVGVFATLLIFLQLLSTSALVYLSDMLYRVFAAMALGHFGFGNNPEKYKHAIEGGLAAYRELLSLTNPATLVPLLLLCAALAVVVLFVRNNMSLREFRLAAVGLSILTILSVGVLSWRSYGPSEKLSGPPAFPALYGGDVATRGRIYSFMSGDAATPYIPPQYQLSPTEDRAIVELNGASAVPNLNILNGLASVDGYDQFEPREILAAMEMVGGELGAGYGSGTPAQRRERLLSHLDLFGMMGGKYVLAGAPLESPQLLLVATSTTTPYNMTLYLYENTLVLPLYYFATTTRMLPHQNFTDLRERPDMRWGSITYLDCADCTVPAPLPASLELAQSSNGMYEFKTHTPVARYLVLSVSFLPGWQAFIDGIPATLVRANGLYMALLVPAGEHSVRFEYQGMLGELGLLRTLGLVQ